MRLFELTEAKLQPFKLGPTTPNQMDMMKDPEYWRKKKGVTWEIEWMSPNEYIERCAQGFQTDEMEIRRQRDSELIDDYRFDMEDGDKFPMLDLDYRDGAFGQEGLHRAMAAERANVEQVPVFIMRDTPEKKEKRNDERRAEMAAIKAKLEKDQADGWDKDRQSSVVDDILGSFDEDLNEYKEIAHDTENDEGNIFGYVVDTDEEQLVNYFVLNHGVSKLVINEIRRAFDTVAVLRNVVVEDEYMNRGHGTELMEAFIEEAAENGAQAILLVADTLEDNEFDLVKWYEGWGFESIAQTGSGPMMVMYL